MIQAKPSHGTVSFKQSNVAALSHCCTLGRSALPYYYSSTLPSPIFPSSHVGPLFIHTSAFSLPMSVANSGLQPHTFSSSSFLSPLSRHFSLFSLIIITAKNMGLRDVTAFFLSLTTLLT